MSNSTTSSTNSTTNSTTALTGRIYRVISVSNPGVVYIGSTFDTLPSRMAKHRYACKAASQGRFHWVSVADVLQYGDAKIELVETYKCASKAELELREREIIHSTVCVNVYHNPNRKRGVVRPATQN